MQDLFRTLEFIEDRPQSEIIKALKNVKQVALEKECEILSLKFKFLFEDNKSHFSAKEMGKVLTSLQDLCDAVGQSDTGKISNYEKKKNLEKIELSVFETFKGSFGIKLAFPPNAGQLNWLEEPIAEKISDTLINLINLSEKPDKEELKNFLILLQRRSASQYRRFLVSLIKAKSNFDINWGSVNPDGGGYASLSYQNTINTVDFINRMEVEDPEEYTIIGELVIANKIKSSIEIENLEDNKKYAGTLSSSVLTPGLELTIGRLYSVVFQEIISLNPATGEEKIERSVISISYLQA